MKYCSHCGAQVEDAAVVCVSCGCSVAQNNAAENTNNTLATVVKVFLIIGCVATGWAIIPLAWCIPITVSIWKKLGAGQPIGTGMKVCTLLFVSLIAGICLLCMKDSTNA